MTNEILHPVDVVQPQGNGRNQPFHGDVNRKPKILLQERTGQSSHRLGVLEIQAEEVQAAVTGASALSLATPPGTATALGSRSTAPGPGPARPSRRRALPHPAGEGGLYVLLELGVLAGQVSEVGRLVLVPVASVHGLVEGHGGGEPPRERGAGSPPSPPTDRPAPGEHRGALGRTKVRQARGGASGCQTAQTIAQSGEGGGGGERLLPWESGD